MLLLEAATTTTSATTTTATATTTTATTTTPFVFVGPAVGNFPAVAAAAAERISIPSNQRVGGGNKIRSSYERRIVISYGI